MKKYFILAAAAIAALSACNKEIIDTPEAITDPEEIVAPEETPAPVFTATIEPETKTQLVEGTTAGKKKVNWLSTDKVFIWSVDNAGTLRVMGHYNVAPNGSDASSASLTPVENIRYVNSNAGAADITFAFYPNTMSEIDHIPNIDAYKAEGKGAEIQSLNDFYKLRLPSEQTYNGNNISQFAPMAAYSQGGTNLEFKNITSLLAITIPASEFTSIQNIVVTTDKQMWGEFKLDKENMVAVPNQDVEQVYSEYQIELNKVTLNCQNNGANTSIPAGGIKTFYVSIPANTYSYLKIDMTDGTITKTMKTKAASIEVARNKIYPITYRADLNILAGGFTVRASGKKVQFTKGNLYWNGSAFALEEHQYDFPTSANDYHIAHLYWPSYSKYDAHSGESCFPYSLSSYDTSGDRADDTFWCDEAHPLEVAGTQGLYVLSKEEWAYLLNANATSGARTQTNRFARAKVNGVAGLLIFPDGYNGTTEVSGTGIGNVNKTGTQTLTESIPDATWSYMEAAGVVFLPAAGYRDGSNLYTSNDYYWTASVYASEASYSLHFGEYKGLTLGYQKRSKGCSIRLVKTVE